MLALRRSFVLRALESICPTRRDSSRVEPGRDGRGDSRKSGDISGLDCALDLVQTGHLYPPIYRIVFYAASLDGVRSRFVKLSGHHGWWWRRTKVGTPRRINHSRTLTVVCVIGGYEPVNRCRVSAMSVLNGLSCDELN